MHAIAKLQVINIPDVLRCSLAQSELESHELHELLELVSIKFPGLERGCACLLDFTGPVPMGITDGYWSGLDSGRSRTKEYGIRSL